MENSVKRLHEWISDNTHEKDAKVSMHSMAWGTQKRLGLPVTCCLIKKIWQLPDLFSVNYDVELSAISLHNFLFKCLFLNMPQWRTKITENWKGKWNVCVCFKHVYTCMPAQCTIRWMLDYFCPQVNPLLCEFHSRVETTNSGASAGESSQPQHTHLTTVHPFSYLQQKIEIFALTLWMKMTYKNFKWITFSHSQGKSPRPICPKRLSIQTAKTSCL